MSVASTIFLMLQAAAPQPAATATAAPDQTKTMMANYRQRTSAVISCKRTSNKDEIVVCAWRDADLYRVPLMRPVQLGRLSTGERVKMLTLPTPCESMSPFLVGCGMVGVSASVGFGGKGAGKMKVRPLAK